jgi:hypothetical protein
MTYGEMTLELTKLPLKERLALIEMLTRSVREELISWSVTDQPVELQESAALRPKPGSSLSRVLGMLKPDGPMPTDDELKEDYIKYLTGKYL